MNTLMASRNSNNNRPDPMIHALMESGTVPPQFLEQFLSSSPEIRRRCLDSGQPITAGSLLGIHPLADIFPAMSREQYEALRDDIVENGVLEPIWLYEGCIIDGKHRQKACMELGIDPPTRKYTGKDPIAFVITKNLRRRHLTESQRAMVAANIANMDRGCQPGNRNARKNKPANLPVCFEPPPTVSPEPRKVSQKEAAKLLNVSERSIRNAKKIRELGAPELIKAIEDGELAVSSGADIVRHTSPRLQEKILQEGLAIKAAQYLRSHPEKAHAWTDEQHADRVLQDLYRSTPEQKKSLSSGNWPSWIVISQHLPKPGTRNLVFVPDTSPQLGHTDIATFTGPGAQDWSPRLAPSHWMPEPPPPLVPFRENHYE